MKRTLNSNARPPQRPVGPVGSTRDNLIRWRAVGLKSLSFRVMHIKKHLGEFALPLARLWIRYAKTPLFKRFLWRQVKWRNHQYTARTRFGSRFRGQSIDLVQGYIYYFGVWEPHLTEWIAERLARHRNRVFVDVGANVGYYTLLAANLLTAEGQVVSIEASPMIHRMLEDNIRLNGLSNVRTVCGAAMAERGLLTLYHGDATNLGSSTTLSNTVGDDRRVETIGMPLSEILSEVEVLRARLIKIDVEGAEWSAVQGLVPILGKFAPDAEFIVETAPANFAKLLAFFEDAGFQPYIVENSYEPYLVPVKIRRPERLTTTPSNLVDLIFSRIDADHL